MAGLTGGGPRRAQHVAIALGRPWKHFIFESLPQEQCGRRATVTNFLAAIAHWPRPAQRSAMFELLIDGRAPALWCGRSDRY
jgi:hypothetical protein